MSRKSFVKRAELLKKYMCIQITMLFSPNKVLFITNKLKNWFMIHQTHEKRLNLEESLILEGLSFSVKMIFFLHYWCQNMSATSPKPQNILELYQNMFSASLNKKYLVYDRFDWNRFYPPCRYGVYSCTVQIYSSPWFVSQGSS